MSDLTGVVILVAAAVFFARSASRARGAWAGPRTGGMRSRSIAPARTARQELRFLAEKAGIDDWLEQRRHQRAVAAKGGTTAPAAPGPPRGGPSRFRPRIRLRATRARAGTGGTLEMCPCGRPLANGYCRGCSMLAAKCTCTAAPASGRRKSSRAPAAPPPARPGPGGNPPPPAAPAVPPPPPPASTGRTPVAAGTSTALAERLIQGCEEIHNRALAGNIIAKRESLLAAREGSVRFSATLQALARAMSEPGRNYGPEITEAITKAAQHEQAAAMCLGEAEQALATLMRLQLGEAPGSGRQIPHNSELSETGAA